VKDHIKVDDAASSKQQAASSKRAKDHIKVDDAHRREARRHFKIGVEGRLIHEGGEESPLATIEGPKPLIQRDDVVAVQGRRV